MKRLSTALLCVVVIVAVSIPAAISALAAEMEYLLDGVQYTRYINTRYGFSIPYPSELLVPQPPPGNNDGREFYSHDKRAQMGAWGTYNVMEETLAERFAAEKSDPDRTVTLDVMKDDWFVISGYIDGRIFYMRTYLVEDIFYTFYIVYDQDLSDMFDPITAHISGEFRIPGMIQ